LEKETMSEQALSDVKVLDLTWYIAGSYCTKLLADYGADVIKVESLPDGDPARKMKPFFGDDPHPEKSGLFLLLNTNKRSITLNLKSDWGRKVIKELVRGVDILVESFSPRVMPSLGLDYESLEKINPKLVMTSISNFGQTGPYRDFKASELIIYGMGGAMFCNGLPEREPLKEGLTVNLFQGGNMAAVATMMAFYASRLQGIGQQVDVSLMETQMGTVDRRLSQLVVYQWNKDCSYRANPLDRPIFPFGIYPCKDGYFELSGVGTLWPRVGKMIGMPELVEDPRFSNPVAQQMPGHKEQFDAIFIAWCMEHTKKEIIEAGQRAGIMCGPLNNTEELLNDPHFQERGFWAEIDHPMAGKLTYPGRLFVSEEMPWEIRRPAPLLGQHNAEVYIEKLGYSQQDVVRLREQGLI
jgi:crotonobetainyl-CoA:carnitine CoA-transferase CaiB-like acyl-CoA transferase